MNGLGGFRAPLFDPGDVLRLYRDEQLVQLVPSLDFETERKARAGSQGSAMIDYHARHFTGER